MKNTKTHKVVMLPTEKASDLLLHTLTDIKPILYFKQDYKGTNGKYQHLYIVSDDEIQRGDWAINSLNEIYQLKKDHFPLIINGIKHQKIIATTDKLLYLLKDNKDGFSTTEALPQLPESFIQAYVKAYNAGKPITEVDLEMENKQVSINYHKDLWVDNWVVKTRPDNTVILHQSKLYTKDEIVNIHIEIMKIGLISEGEKKWKDKYEPRIRKIANKWISENI